MPRPIGMIELTRKGGGRVLIPAEMIGPVLEHFKVVDFVPQLDQPDGCVVKLKAPASHEYFDVEESLDDIGEAYNALIADRLVYLEATEVVAPAGMDALGFTLNGKDA